MYAAEHAALEPDKPAIIMATSREVVTYAGYEAAANKVAHLFRCCSIFSNACCISVSSEA